MSKIIFKEEDMKPISLFNMDNMNFWSEVPLDFIYADHIFEEQDFSWIDHYWGMLKENGIFAIHTDHKLFHRIKCHMEDNLDGSVWVNELITYQEWGGRSKKRFSQKHDYILVYAKGKMWTFNSADIQIPKQMVNKKLNPSGRTTKTPSSLWHDLGNFSTTSSERVKSEDGKNIRWQKPLKQLRRLITPFVKEGDVVLDPFMGSGTSGVVALELGCSYIGIEIDEVPYKLEMERLQCGA